jgi:hypothetical protein
MSEVLMNKIDIGLQAYSRVSPPPPEFVIASGHYELIEAFENRHTEVN